MTSLLSTLNSVARVQLPDAAGHVVWLDSLVVAGCADGSVMMMDGDQAATIVRCGSPVSALLAHNDSIVAGFIDGDVLRVRHGEACVVASDQGVPRSLVETPGGVAWAASEDVQIRRLDGLAVSVDARIGDIRHLAVVQGGLLFVGGVSGGAWVDTTLDLVDDIVAAPTLIAVAVDPLHRFVAAGDLAGSIHVIGVGDTVGNELSGYPDRVHLLGWLPSGRGLCAAADDELTVWAADRVGVGDSDPQQLVGHDRPITALAAHPRVDVVITGDSGGLIRLWSPAVVDEPVASAQLSGVILGVAWHPDGHRIAVGTSDGNLTVLGMRSGSVA